MLKNKNAFLLPFLLLLFTSIGIFIGGKIKSNPADLYAVRGTEANFSTMKDIIDVIDAKYVDPIKKDKLFQQTISDMLHKLDPHSNYIPAKDVALANEMIEGKFGGVGIRFAIIRDTLCVTNVIAGSPSEKVGVKAGDKILKIDGKKIAGVKLESEKVMGMLKGVENTPVNIVILRKKELLTKKIIRGSIPITSITAAIMLDKETGYIRLEQFSVTSSEEFHEAAAGLLKKGMKKLVFDLRDNGGGVLSGANEIADEFLKDKLKIVEVKGAHTPTQTYRATGAGMLENVELVVLINDGSASASEIVAGALQDNDRATVIGRRSFGKGLVQQDFGLRDGSNLRLTIARYYTPTGRSIQKPFDGNMDNYIHDQERREDNGELFAPDTSLFVDSLKFKTPKGKIVYGGGGIMPDIFVAIDTSNASWYYVQLRYSAAFQNFAFDFVQDKRTKWKSPADFMQNFKVSRELVDQFTVYAAKQQKIKKVDSEFKASYALIEHSLKAEIARQLFTEQGYFTVSTQYDREVQRALKYFKTRK